MLAGGLLVSQQALAVYEFNGKAAIEQRYFTQQGLYQEQSKSQLSGWLEPEWYWQSDNANHSLVFKPYYRLDQHDNERSHGDIRELMYTYATASWEWQVGVGKVFWGQTESLHLVDVINQTDSVEAVDGEDKLGQPMLKASYIGDSGTYSAFVLPYFRERTFAGPDGRLRAPLRVDTDNPLFESDDEQSNLDWALRWQHSLGDWELGLSYFDGTNREPGLQVGQDGNEPVLVPYYQQMQQLGLDVLAVVEAWLLKLEAIQRKTDSQDYLAAVAGFEYTSVGVFESAWDIGWLMEYQYDERKAEATTPAQNDLMLGARLVVNDVDGTEILLGWVQDLDHSDSRSAFVEASSRINDNWKWSLNGWFFSSEQPQDPVYLIRKDDFIEFSLEYYF